jgi:hypothetical protein
VGSDHRLGAAVEDETSLRAATVAGEDETVLRDTGLADEAKTSLRDATVAGEDETVLRDTGFADEAKTSLRDATVAGEDETVLRDTGFADEATTSLRNAASGLLTPTLLPAGSARFSGRGAGRVGTGDFIRAPDGFGAGAATAVLTGVAATLELSLPRGEALDALVGALADTALKVRALTAVCRETA